MCLLKSRRRYTELCTTKRHDLVIPYKGSATALPFCMRDTTYESDALY